MAGRALAFAEAEIVRMASEDYVPVTGDDWYERRRQDAEGQFFRKIADQGPRKGAGGSSIPGWVWLLTGVVTGAFIMFLVYLSGLSPQMLQGGKLTNKTQQTTDN